MRKNRAREAAARPYGNGIILAADMTGDAAEYRDMLRGGTGKALTEDSTAGEER